MTPVALRLATRDDCPAINDILNHYVVTSTATFITEPQSLEDRQAWFDGRGEAHPVVVAERGGDVVGWASLSPFRTRAAYARTAEVGVYVRSDCHRQGIGRALVTDIVSRARGAGHHVVIGGCCRESTGSLGLLVACGFTQVAHFHQVGYKFGRWLDVIFLERILG